MGPALEPTVLGLSWVIASAQKLSVRCSAQCRIFQRFHVSGKVTDLAKQPSADLHFTPVRKVGQSLERQSETPASLSRCLQESIMWLRRLERGRLHRVKIGKKEAVSGYVS